MSTTVKGKRMRFEPHIKVFTPDAPEYAQTYFGVQAVDRNFSREGWHIVPLLTFFHEGVAFVYYCGLNTAELVGSTADVTLWVYNTASDTHTNISALHDDLVFHGAKQSLDDVILQDGEVSMLTDNQYPMARMRGAVYHNGVLHIIAGGGSASSPQYYYSQIIITGTASATFSLDYKNQIYPINNTHLGLIRGEDGVFYVIHSELDVNKVMVYAQPATSDVSEVKCIFGITGWFIGRYGEYIHELTTQVYVDKDGNFYVPIVMTNHMPEFVGAATTMRRRVYVFFRDKVKDVVYQFWAFEEDLGEYWAQVHDYYSGCSIPKLSFKEDPEDLEGAQICVVKFMHMIKIPRAEINNYPNAWRLLQIEFKHSAYSPPPVSTGFPVQRIGDNVTEICGNLPRPGWGCSHDLRIGGLPTTSNLLNFFDNPGRGTIEFLYMNDTGANPYVNISWGLRAYPFPSGPMTRAHNWDQVNNLTFQTYRPMGTSYSAALTVETRPSSGNEQYFKVLDTYFIRTISGIIPKDAAVTFTHPDNGFVNLTDRYNTPVAYFEELVHRPDGEAIAVSWLHVEAYEYAEPTTPYITSVTPARAKTGQTVTVSGTLFGVGGTLMIGTQEIAPVTWAPTTVTFVFPSGYTAGKITIANDGGTSNAVPITQIFTWTDDPITPGETPIKPVHIYELRTHLSGKRTAAGLVNAPWSSSPAVGDNVRILEISELRAVLLTHFPGAVFTDPDFTQLERIQATDRNGQPVTLVKLQPKAAHISELRKLVDDLTL